MQQDLPIDAKALKKLGLRYAMDGEGGIQRRKKGKAFVYLTAGGKRIADKRVIARIASLVIPPAWTEVWISPSDDGHLQATGRDARKRKQYRYHARYREMRDVTKFNRTIEFAQVLPHLRRVIKRDLSAKGLPKHQVLAAVVKLLEETHIRIGNEEYVRENNSFGLSTLRDRHVKFSGSEIRFLFKGKSGKHHDISFRDPLLSKIVKRCQDLPGQQLFQYLAEDGSVQAICSQDVNDYVREHSREEFTAKDFRTWSGTVLAALELEKMGRTSSAAAAKRNIAAAVKTVSGELRNLPSTCRKYYIHPHIIESYVDGSLFKLMKQGRTAGHKRGLSSDEAAVLHVLEVLTRSQKLSGKFHLR